MSDALLIAAHGSREASGIEELRAFAEAWRQLRPDRLQAAGFLEFARPTLGEAIDMLVEQGARRIVVAPAMLMAAGHVKNDVPSEIHEGRERHPGVAFHMARPLDIHPALLELCHVRYREATADRPDVSAESTLLLLVGRGTSDPDANANIARVARFLWEAYGVGWASIAFAGLAAPGVDQALNVCRRLGYARIVVQPYFLFDGILLQRIIATARWHAQADPDVEILTTAHFRLHPLLLRAFEDRAHEAIHGAPHMNCDLCKYRVRLAGREADLGAPQVGHHHHARAVGEPDGDHGHLSPSRTGASRRRRNAVDSLGALASHPWDERLLHRLQLGRGEPSPQ
jgi:sirohydrochlorin cobaltochelatase